MKRIVIGPEVVAWAEKVLNCEFARNDVGIGLEDNGKICAAVVFNEFNGANMCIHVASDGTRRWMNKDLLALTFDYAFNQAGVRRLTGIVPESNIAARQFDEHLGFKEETRLKDAHPDGDLILYRMTKAECRFLNIKEKRKERSHHGQIVCTTPA